MYKKIYTQYIYICIGMKRKPMLIASRELLIFSFVCFQNSFSDLIMYIRNKGNLLLYYLGQKKEAIPAAYPYHKNT